MSNLADRLLGVYCPDTPEVRLAVERVLEEVRRQALRDVARAIWLESKNTK